MAKEKVKYRPCKKTIGFSYRLDPMARSHTTITISAKLSYYIALCHLLFFFCLSFHIYPENNKNAEVFLLKAKDIWQDERFIFKLRAPKAMSVRLLPFSHNASRAPTLVIESLPKADFYLYHTSFQIRRPFSQLPQELYGQCPFKRIPEKEYFEIFTECDVQIANESLRRKLSLKRIKNKLYFSLLTWRKSFAWSARDRERLLEYH